MEKTICNSAKSRLETINVDITEKTSTWFDDLSQDDAVYRITDFNDSLLIAKKTYEYPFCVHDVSRSNVDYDRQKTEMIFSNSLEYWKMRASGFF